MGSSGGGRCRSNKSGRGPDPGGFGLVQHHQYDWSPGDAEDEHDPRPRSRYGETEVTRGAGPGGSLGGFRAAERGCATGWHGAKPSAQRGTPVAQLPSRAKLRGVPFPKDEGVPAGALWFFVSRGLVKSEPPPAALGGRAPRGFLCCPQRRFERTFSLCPSCAVLGAAPSCGPEPSQAAQTLRR